MRALSRILTAAFPLFALAVALLGGLGAAAEDRPQKKAAQTFYLPPPTVKQIDFSRDIEPIFRQRCYQCHGSGDISSGLRLGRRTNILSGGESGEPAVVLGHSDRSKLVQLIARVDPDEVMPPSGKPLAQNQVSLIRAWIDQGLKMPDEKTGEIKLWSFQPLKKNEPPKCADAWAAGPIDAFVLKKLEANKLRPSPRADRVKLIRRVFLDMLGLPPTPKEVESFVNSTDPAAYTHLVDKVLASPHYGERWARHWLDVIRFADSDGYETNVERPNSYHFRDYLIRAFNEDRPFDRMIVEQLAGDAVGEDAATAFLVGGAVDRVGSPDIVLTRTQRQDELADMIGTTGTAFLGLTIGCARCHDHKFDPISQRDYYSMQAVFAGVQHEERPLKHVDGKEAAWLKKTIADAGKRPAVDAALNEEVFAPTPARAVRFTIRATNDGTEPCIDELEVFEATGNSTAARNTFLTSAPRMGEARRPPRNVALASAGGRPSSSGNFIDPVKHKLEHINDGRYGNEWSWISKERGCGWVRIDFPKTVAVDRIMWARDRNKQFTDRLATDYVIEVLSEQGNWRQVASSADRRPYAVAAPMVYAGKFVQPGPTFRLNRGDAMQPREQVVPEATGALVARLGSLALKADSPEQQRRLALARWIARADNPLTPRVAVNRLWQNHFGAGIVASPSDFGRMGIPPTHPELLDWLAGELIRNHWRLKPIHRLILLSNTYQQSDLPNPQGLAADATCRWLWRFPPRRLEAEAIRDSVLQTSGVLDLTMYGPGFSGFESNDNYVRVYKPKSVWGPAEWRRMVYMTKIRREQDGVFGVFDQPDSGQVCPRRSRSTTAIQALNMLNSSFMVQQSQIMAARVKREAGNKTGDCVRRAFWLALGRAPEQVERAAGERLAAEQGLPSVCRALFNTNEFLFLP